MSILEELQQYVDCNHLMGAWVQKGRNITHVTDALGDEVVLSLGLLSVSVFDHYKSIGQEPETILFGYSGGQVLLVKLRASMVGVALPPGFKLVDELVAGVRKVALVATLELLQAKPIMTVEPKVQISDSDDPDEVLFTKWDDLMDRVKGDLTKVLNASQIDAFIQIQLKGYKPQTVKEVYQAMSRIANGIPDKNKQELMRKTFEDKIKELIK